MQIKGHILRNWKSYLDNGDLTKIAEQSGISRQTISLAINRGHATPKTIAAIKSFVELKKMVLS